MSKMNADDALFWEAILYGLLMPLGAIAVVCITLYLVYLLAVVTTL